MRTGFPLLFLFILLGVSPVYAQTRTASGTGTGTTKEFAVEAAKLDAANTLIFTVLKRDTVFRDLFVPEAFNNEWFPAVEARKDASGAWTATAGIAVDDSLIEALYVGRYSTTVTALLDAAETALAEAEALIAAGGRAESNADLIGAETAYSRGEAKIDEILRYLGPVTDARYFSSLGKRKAPELKALAAASQGSAQAGAARIKAGRGRLEADSQSDAVTAILESTETEIAGVDALADELYPVAAAPRSYQETYLRTSRDQARQARNTLEQRRLRVEAAVADLPGEKQYPRRQAALLTDRLDAIAARLDAVDRAVSAELFRRSPPVRTTVWALNHPPQDHFSLALVLPCGWRTSEGDTRLVGLPLAVEGRGEGAFVVDGGGLWFRSLLRAGDESILEGADFALTQGVEAGFYGRRLWGLGFRWDWLRRDADGAGRDAVGAVSFLFGAPGGGLGAQRNVPLWVNAFSWEIPGAGVFIPARTFNLGVSSLLRPSPWVRIGVDAASRARTDGDDRFRWVGLLGASFGFRLPVLRPLLWSLRWEAAAGAPLRDDAPDFDQLESENAFRLAVEYTF